MPTLSPSMNVMELLHYKPQRCTWCGEVAEGHEDAMPRTAGLPGGGYIPLCGTCADVNRMLDRMDLDVCRAEYLLNLSPLPQPGEVTEHNITGWRGMGDVLATDGALTQVAWPNGSVLWHLSTDLRRIKARRPRPEDNYPREKVAA